ncbi:uncharacterized protein SPSC_02758 [Sporisorium scitamineum]|uniref:Uncharacterized protein n=1 Tax=Sporisorium scitamineum TaxID=49012 RepID=A0A0F7SDK6_9BASI|nr:uncharacterized protein SPSC_02758 [Sporisorium scitamineum]CDW99630.1 hypothetical protein [Sporisorium scitamineum]
MSYATLNTRYNLPPPPPKSVFSTISNQSGRAWFPDFGAEQDPVGSLKHFIRILFYPSLRQSTFTQLKVLSVLTAIIGLWIFLIILRRLWEKSFWLFRLVRRSNGTLLVPNAITAFVAIESTFAILLIALCWNVIEWFQQGKSPKSIILWIGLTWLPLILGAWCTTIGIIYARPDALSFVSPQPGKPHSWALRMGVTPMVFNLFVFLIPVIQIASVVVPAVLAHQRFSSAFDHYHRWAAAIQPGESLSRDLLLEAQQIWFQVLDAAYYLSICMVVWEAWVCGLFVCYCSAGGSLIATLRAQLKTLRTFKQNRSFSESFAEQNAKAAHMRRPSDAPTIAIQNHDDVEKQTTGPTTPALLSAQAPPQRSSSMSSAVSDNVTLISGDSGLKRSDSQSGAAGGKVVPAATRRAVSNQDDVNEEQTRSMYFTREELENEDEPFNSFFPSVRPSAFERPTQAQSLAGKENAHKRYLEKFYINFVVQFLGLMLCILFFVIFVGMLITAWYSAWEANDLATSLQIALLVVCWVTIALASVIIFAILSRTYEPVLANLGAVSSSRLSGGRRVSLTSNLNSASGQPRSGRRLSGAKAWVATMLSQLSSEEDRRSQQIGLENVHASRRGSRAGSLSAVGRTSMHAYAELDGEQASPSIEQGPPSPESQPLTFRRAISSSTPDLQASSMMSRPPPSDSHRQRLLRGSVISKNGVMVEQTVSTIVEDPAVEEYFQIERPVRAARPSPTKIDVSEQDLYTPYTLDSHFSTPNRFQHDSEWADSPTTPATMWTPATPLSAKPLVAKSKRSGQDSDGWLSPLARGATNAANREEHVLPRSRSDVALRPPPRSRSINASSSDSVGLGIAMASSPSPPWTAPTEWASGQPDPVLMQEDAKMRLRMASHPTS